ncbi:MAG: GlsB/YeaQ/YmgE family stress response membrane protein [Acidimicrobiales bacterium]
MPLIGLIISLVITGLIVGALGRLAIPGPNPMSIGMTILVGIVGALVGALVGAALSASAGIIIILQILCAAGIVYLMQRRPNRVV